VTYYFGEHTMLKRIAIISLGSAIVLAPLSALAQTGQSAAVTASARSAKHKIETKHERGMGKEKAASAKHMHRSQHLVQP
jgi:hypothetical protein